MLEERNEISADTAQNPAKRRRTVIENNTENYNIKNLEKSFEQNKDRVIRLLYNAIQEHENILFNLKLHIEYELLLDRDLYELKELIHQSGMKKLYSNNDISKIYREQCRVIAKNIQRFIEHNDGAKRRHVKHLTVDIYKYIDRKQTSKNAAENADENVSETSSTDILSNQNSTARSKGLQSSTANIHIPIFDLTEDDLQFPPSRMAIINKEVCANNSLPSTSANFALETFDNTSTSKCSQSSSSNIHIPTFDLTKDHLKFPSSTEEGTIKEVGANNTSANIALETFDDIEIEMDEDIQTSLPEVPLTANTSKEIYTQSSTSENIPMEISENTETISKDNTQHSSTIAESSQEFVFPEKISQSFTTAKQPLQISDNTENINVNTLQSFNTKTPASIPKNKNTNSKTFPVLPIDIIRKKACIGILNNDIYNFKWAIISALQKANQNPQRCSQYNIANISNAIIRLENDIIVNFQGLNFPYTTLNDVKEFQLQNPQISVNVFGVENDNKTVGLYSICDVEKPKHINLLLLRENEKTHYFWIRNLSR